MADEHARTAEGPALAGDGEHAEDARPAAPHGLLHEAVMLLRWLTGMLIVLVCGWGFIVVIALLARKGDVPVPLDVAATVSALVSFGAFVLLERNFWLSRFMGLRISLASPVAEAALLWFLGIPGLLFRSTNAPTAEAAPGQARTPADSDSLREVVETIAFVIVLVLMLKTFVAEAFVIPTGSMAETLLGYHRQVTCPACGYTFPVNISAEVDPQNRQSEQITGCTCPNCRLHIQFDQKR